jgi:hypothetical protein
LKLDKQLNLVINIKRPDGSSVFVHSMPMPSEIFSLYFERAGQTMNALYSGGLGLFAPRYAYDMLRKISLKHKDWEGPSGIEIGFMAEIRRLTSAIFMGANGWDTVPLENALKNDLLDVDEIKEIYGALVFFTFALHSHLKSDQPLWENALDMWNARISLLNSTDFMRSLPTSTAAASTGATAPA